MKVSHPLSDGLKAHGFTGKCSVCGEPSSACWFGTSLIEICPCCATRTLPALIADATAPARLSHPDTAENVWRRAESGYWKAVASAAMAELRKYPFPPPPPESVEDDYPNS